VELLCDVIEAELLLDRATKFYPEAVPYIQQALDSVRHLSLSAILRPTRAAF